MSIEQINTLLEPEEPEAPVDQEAAVIEPVESIVEPTNQPVEVPPEVPQQEASEILSAPPPAEPIGVTAVLKTRKDLIQKITEVCKVRGTDPKPLNLKRRRKKSLENILATQFSEAAEQETAHEVHPDLQGALPPGMQARTQFAVDMAYRLDLLCCKLLERGCEATDSWHGMSIDGFASSIEDNQTLTSEIKQCWLEIIEEPENEWILDACTSTTRLMLCHMYGISACMRKKKPQHVTYPRAPPPRPIRQEVRVAPPPIKKNALPHVEARRAPGKLRGFMRKRSASGQNKSDQGTVHPGTSSVVKEV